MLLKEITEEQPQRYTIFVDLDGVLANFFKGVKTLVPDYTEEKYEHDKKYKNKVWDIINKHGQSGGELWYDLEMLPDAHELWNYIKPYHPAILTASGTSVKSVGEQKRRWVKKHLGDPVVHVVERAQDKQKFAGKTHILIDDKRKALDPWISAGGVGILHTSAANTIKELKKLGL